MKLARTEEPWQPSNFWDLFFKALPALGGSATFLIPVFGIFAYFVGLDVKASVAWVVLTAFVALPFIVMLCDMVRRALSDVRQALAERPTELPRVLRSLPAPLSPGGLLLLVEPSSLLGQGIAVSVYSVVDEFEILIGEGLVQVVQRNQKAQVGITRVTEGNEPIWRSLTDNSPDVLKRTLIRPGHQVQRNG